MAADLALTVARVPRVIAAFGIVGTLVAGYVGGLSSAVAFLMGAIGAYYNFRLIERFVIRLVHTVVQRPQKRPKLPGLKLFLQLALFVAGAFVILRFSGFNLMVAFCGFLVCPAAVMLEAIYYLITYYGHS